MHRLRYISILFFMLIGSTIWSQTHNIVFEDFAANGMMEGKSVIKIVQDKEGFMWFGALDGLYRYDGSSVKPFQYDEMDSTSLADNYIRALLVDSKGALWVGTWNKGLNLYLPEEESFVRYVHEPDDPTSISANDLEDIFEDSFGRLWVVTGSNGLNLLNAGRKDFRRFGGQGTLRNDSLWVVTEDREKKLWIGHRDGVDLLDLETLNRITLPTAFEELENKWVTAVHEDQLGNIWFGTWRNGLYRWNKEENSLSKIQYEDGEELLSIKDFFEGPQGRLWITAGNVYFWDPDLEQLSAYQSAINASHKLEELTNWPIFQDREGTIWVGNWSGISRYQARGNILDYSYRRLFKDRSFYKDPIRFLSEDEKGNFWIAWEEAIGYWDLQKQDLNYYDLEGKLYFEEERYAIRDVFQDARGYLWLSTNIGAYRFDLESKELVHLNELLDQEIPGLYIYTPEFISDEQGNLWIASMERGLFYYDWKKNKVNTFSNDPDVAGSIGHNLVDHIYLDDEGILWLATYGAGVERFDTGTHKVTHRFKHEPGNPRSLSQDRVLDIIEDDHEQLWVGTTDGLNIIDKKSLSVSDLRKTIGLDKGSFSSLQLNVHGRIIANNSKDLLVIDPSDLSVERIRNFAGLEHFTLVNKANRAYFIQDENNIVSFSLDSIQRNTSIPHVMITDLSYRRMENAQEKQYELKGISQKKSVKLSYQDDLITIGFAALSFTKPTQNQFKYRLLPSNPNWISLGNQSSVNFMNLPPRKYTFEVMGANGDGIWNPEATSLEIVITPPWWASSLARIIYLLGFFSALIIFIRLRLRSLINRQKILEESVVERTRELAIAKQEAEEANEAKSVFLSTVSHELRTPLTSIIGFTKLNKKSLEEKILPAIDTQNKKALRAAGQLDQNLDIVTTEGKRLTTLINDLLDLAKIEAGKVEWKMEKVDPREIIDQALSSTAVLFEEKKLALNTDISGDLGKIKADKDRIIQVIINLISNAVKFTDKGEIKVSAKPENGNLLLSIKDTGKGIAFEDLSKVFEKFKQVGDNMTDKPQGTGLGLPICKEIIDFHKGEIWVESKEGKGSTFSFLLPLFKE